MAQNGNKDAPSVIDVREATAQEWDNTWRECRHATFHHSREWFEIWSRYRHGRVTATPRWLVFSDGRKALIPMALQRRHHGLIADHVTSPGDATGGWLAVDNLDEAHATLIAEHLLGLPNLRWRLNPFDAALHTLDVPLTRKESTDVIDLDAGLDASLRRWSKPYRDGADRAPEEGLTVFPATTVDHWRAYYRMYRPGAGPERRRGGPPGWALYDSIFARGSEDARLWLAVRKQRLLAGAVCFYAREHGVCWQAAIAGEVRTRVDVLPLLFRSILADAAERRLRWFEIANPAERGGVAIAGRHLGARPASCGRVDVKSLAHRFVRTLSAIKTAARSGLSTG